MLTQCCCDPYKLTYISAIVTSVEAVLFGILNIVLLSMTTCTIKPPSSVALGFDRFWAYYFYDETACSERYVNYSAPSWTTEDFPLLDEERSYTTVQDNYIYQMTYLIFHIFWFFSALILIYGNAKKRWGYYLPWLLISIALAVLDIIISAFCIQDLVTVTDTGGYRSAMFWILALYFRIFFFWFLNMTEFASAFNAFCKARHKRTKQERQRKMLQKRHEKELAAAGAAAESRVRAEVAEEQRQQAERVLMLQKSHKKELAAAEAVPKSMVRAEDQRQHAERTGERALVVQAEIQRELEGNAGSLDVQPRRKIPPPVPKKPVAPPELRPFSYLNPAFRPNNPADVEGMRAHSSPAPDIPPRPQRIRTLEGPYFPSDEYTKTMDLHGLPRRHDSLRNYRTQNLPSGIRHFSSFRGQPTYLIRKPYEPPPDYDDPHYVLKMQGPSMSYTPYKQHPSSPYTSASAPPLMPAYHNPAFSSHSNEGMHYNSRPPPYYKGHSSPDGVDQPSDVKKTTYYV